MASFSFNFAGNTTTATNPSTTPAANTFSFPNSATSTTSSLKFGTNTLGGTTTTPSNLLNLSSTPAQTQSSSTGILSSSNTTLTGVQTLNTATTTSTITFKTLEEHINTWMNDLDTQEKEFLDQACQLNALDRLMIDNGEKIVDLNTEVDRLKNEQNKLEQELDFITGQQSYLEQSIKKLETGIEQMPAITKQYGDEERVQTYQLLLTIDNQLNTMSTDLKDIIKRLNATNVNLNDPAVQISKILNAHMDSLSYIEENTSAIQNQVDQLTKGISDKIKETEKTTKSSFLM